MQLLAKTRPLLGREGGGGKGALLLADESESWDVCVARTGGGAQKLVMLGS